MAASFAKRLYLSSGLLTAEAKPMFESDVGRNPWTVDTREALLFFFLNYELQVSVRIMIVSHGPVHSGSVHCDTRWALCE